jgi:hypothetical protein
MAEYWGDDQVRAFLTARAVGDADPRVRAGALRAIARWWSDDEMLAFLTARGADDPDPVPREAVRKILMPYQRQERIRVDGKMRRIATREPRAARKKI